MWYQTNRARIVQGRGKTPVWSENGVRKRQQEEAGERRPIYVLGPGACLFITFLLNSGAPSKLGPAVGTRERNSRDANPAVSLKGRIKKDGIKGARA